MNHFTIEPEKNFFKSLVVDVTHRCNMACENCYIPNRKIPDMDKNTLFQFIDQLKTKTFIRLIGAEPTMRKDLPEIISYIKAKGHHPSVTTNGLKLSDLEYAKELRDAGLKMVYISMNGAANNKFYKKIDGGHYAEKKVAALNNLFQLKFFVDIGCIIAKDVNEPVIKELVDLVITTAKKHHRTFKNFYTPTIRYKSVGKIGRYMKDAFIPTEMLCKMIFSQLKLEDLQFQNNSCITGSNFTIKHSSKLANSWDPGNKNASFVIEMPTDLGPLLLRVIDWSVDENGVPDPNNKNRGRVTQDWKIAPFFEDIKLNEFGY